MSSILSMNLKLKFWSNREPPKPVYEGREFALFNPVSGYNCAQAVFVNGKFVEFIEHRGTSLSQDEYTAWAVLPEASELRRYFPSQRGGVS